MAKRIFLILCILVSTSATFAQTTAFSYQGRLSETGSPPVTGTRFFRFTLFDENGAAIPGAAVERTLMVTQGIFSTSLDFGAGAFPGANRTLEIAVKTNASDAYTVLNPRQEIVAAPYSIKSKTADDSAKLGGVDSTLFVQQDAGGNVSIGGNLTVAGTVTYDTVNATTQYNLGGERILSVNFAKGTLSLGKNTGNPALSHFSIFLGQDAGRINTGDFNTFVGWAAGNENTTGMFNSFVGQASGGANKTGSDNSYFGRASGFLNVSGSDNSIFGSNAGYFNKASKNSFFGSKAGFVNTTGAENSFFGAGAGGANTGGAGNSFFGSLAGGNNTSGFNNSFFGINAGVSNADGSFNSFFGNNAGYNNISGGSNNFFGGSAGSGVTTGSSNSFFGDRAGLGNGGSGAIVSGSGNTMLGSFTTGAANLNFSTAIGANASVTQSNSIVLGAINGINGATADTNVGIGTTAPQTRLQIKTAPGNYGFTQTDGAITIGSYVGSSSSGATGGWLGTLSNNKLFFFTNSGQPSMTVDTTGNVGVGTTAPNSKFTVVGLIETTTGGVKFPDGTIQTTAAGGSSSGVTSLNGLTNNVTLAAGSNVTITPSGNTLTIASTGGGSGGILNQTTLQTGANFNIDGNGSATTFTVGGVAVLRAKNNSISFGRNAGTLANSADDNVFIGTNAGKNNAANNNVYLGYNAGRDNVSGGGNVFVGDQAGAFGATGQRNVFVGQNTGFFNTGNNNSFFGADVGPSTTGSNNVFIGTEAGTNNLGGSNNVFVGVQSAVVNTTGSGNTIIGANAGMSTGSTNLSNTTVIGANTQVSQSNSLILGNNASVGIGTTAPKAKLDVTGGNILIGSPGQGIILKSPDGATCKLLSIDNAGAMVLTSVACP